MNQMIKLQKIKTESIQNFDYIDVKNLCDYKDFNQKRIIFCFQ